MNKSNPKIKTWKNKDGNLCFSFIMKEPMSKPLVVIIIGLLFLLGVVAEYLFFHTTYSMLPLMFLFLYAMMYWSSYGCKYNEEIEVMMMNKNVDLRLHNELKKYDNKVHEVRRKFHQDSQGTYGIVKGTYMLIQLSNDEVLEYELKYHKPTEKELAYFEFINKPVKCIDSTHIKVIRKRNFAKWWTDLKIPDNIILSIIVLLIISIGAVLAYFYIWLMMKFEWRAIVAFGGYVLVLAGIYHLTCQNQNKVLKYVYIIVSLPKDITILWFTLMHPTMIVMFSYALLIIYAFLIPMSAIKSIDIFFDLHICLETILFISLSIGSIICVHGSKFIHWIIKEYSPLKNWGNHKYEEVMSELALYVIHKKNVNFLIYLTYFIFLSISGYLQIQNNDSLITDSIDAAILKAFIVFLAFTNMVSKSRDVELDVKTLLDKMIRLITTHDQ
ncbi:hypothetical protein A9168_16595 [Macellibacteroides sp. HH-ZS]|nr:hypothetical protein A9168_16595 [Macellibacteroides sp. HH-ZS]